MECYLAMKGIKYWYMLQSGWTSETLCLVKEMSHKEPYIVCLLCVYDYPWSVGILGYNVLVPFRVLFY